VVPKRKVVFGYGLGAWNGTDVASGAESVRLAPPGEALSRWAREVVPAVREAIGEEL
jgi:hypothetical protein